MPRGCRFSFRDCAVKKTDHPREVIDAALAYVVQNNVEAAYARPDPEGYIRQSAPGPLRSVRFAFRVASVCWMS